MKELSEVLKNDVETSENKLIALDELSDLVESIDNAKNLFMVDGVAPLIQCIRGTVLTDSSEDEDALRRRAAEVLTTVVQNNPRAQQWAREGGATLNELIVALVSIANDSERVLQTLREKPGDPHLSKLAEKKISTRASLVSAISALVRDNAAGQRDLVSSNSGKALMALLKPIAEWPTFSLGSTLPDKVLLNGRRLIRKTLYALRHLCTGSQADAVMATVLLNGNDVNSSLNIADHLLSASLSWPSEAETASDVNGTMRDIPDIRENALSILIALASDTLSFGGVLEDARDERKPRSLFSGPSGTADTNASGSSNTSQPLLLKDSTVRSTTPSVPVSNSTTEASMLFVPSHDWQEIRQGQRVPAGLEIKLDLATGKQFARQMTTEERAGYRSDFSSNSTSTRSGALAEVSSESADRAKASQTQRKLDEENSLKEKNDSVIVAVRGARFAALLHSINLKFNKESGGVLAYIQKLKDQASLSVTLVDSSTSLSISSDEVRFTNELASILTNIHKNSGALESVDSLRNSTANDVSMD